MESIATTTSPMGLTSKVAAVPPITADVFKDRPLLGRLAALHLRVHGLGNTGALLRVSARDLCSPPPLSLNVLGIAFIGDCRRRRWLPHSGYRLCRQPTGVYVSDVASLMAQFVDSSSVVAFLWQTTGGILYNALAPVPLPGDAVRGYVIRVSQGGRHREANPRLQSGEGDRSGLLHVGDLDRSRPARQCFSWSR